MPGGHEDCPVNELREDLRETGYSLAYNLALCGVETGDSGGFAAEKEARHEIDTLLAPYRQNGGLTEEGQVLMAAAQFCLDRLYARDGSCPESEAW